MMLRVNEVPWRETWYAYESPSSATYKARDSARHYWYDQLKSAMLCSALDDEDDDWEISSNQIRRWFYSLVEKGITKEALLKSAYGEEYYIRN